MKNVFKVNTNIELIEEKDTAGEAFASISLNPFYQWAKIVVTDNKPNENKHRIPKSEFDNLTKTGIFAPVKMAESEQSRSHEDALGKPIGTITQFAVEGNRLIALSALWKKERPEDIASLKEMYLDGKPPQVSWEVAYETEREEDDGVTALLGTNLTGLAVVSDPAYKGRTPFVQMATRNKKKKEEADSVDELEKATTRIGELETDISTLKEQLKAKEDYEDLKAELEKLQEFKAEIERLEKEIEKLAEVKDKFDEAGVEKEDAYFTKNKQTLLGLDENALDFMIQEMVSFAEKQAKASANDGDEDDSNPKVPDFKSKKTAKKSPSELAESLREIDKNKREHK
jgi:HAMP domain-containing protein